MILATRVFRVVLEALGLEPPPDHPVERQVRLLERDQSRRGGPTIEAEARGMEKLEAEEPISVIARPLWWMDR